VSTDEQRVEIDLVSDGTIVVVGELDAFTSPQLDDAIDGLDVVGSAVVIDLAGVTFIDSSALQVLVAHHRRLATGERRLELRNPSDVVIRLLDVSGLAAHFRADTADD
jgi:stage II sporulation protein AA (anti-sigma F factor antagonist)